MAKQETPEARKLTDSDIIEKIVGIRKELFDLRFQQATRQLTKTHRFRQARTELAQLLTIQKERISSNNSSGSN
tara:strand:+ start:1003 stop:1224 length:222 start_codon:yes stop_codon:yes gene_type:complete